MGVTAPPKGAETVGHWGPAWPMLLRSRAEWHWWHVTGGVPGHDRWAELRAPWHGPGPGADPAV
eukprot:3374852-Alexandrium_andersonii.AAC.1